MKYPLNPAVRGTTMRKIARYFIVLLSAVLFLSLSEAALLAQSERTVSSLDGAWSFRQSSAPTSDWRPAIVPGSVHLDLLRNKVIPDPFYRDNEKDLQWIQYASWDYRRSFEVSESQMRSKHIDLVFEGLDAACEVFLNGTRVLTADSMFREWRVDVGKYLHSGQNEILVHFPSPIQAAAKAASADRWRIDTRTAEKTYIRKAAYEYGWDWGPTFVTSGIWRPVRLEFWNDARISDLNVHQRDITASLARIDAEVEIESSVSSDAEVVLRYGLNEAGVSVSRRVKLEPGTNHVTVPIEIANPHLWYPVGYGDHPLYTFTAKVRTGALADSRTVRVGLRSIVLRREPDQWGRSFEFVVNGIPIFAKGADVIPFDSFPTRVTAERYRSILGSAVAANMNMIRLWGGGYYESDEFYSICDELGLMVWQDFMFGNEWQPGLYSWKQNVEEEVRYQLRRLRNHPSIVLWCGNNETEMSWNWDRVTDITKNVSSEVKHRMWQDYLTTFSGIIARSVYQLTPETPYWPSSPSADYEDLEPGQQSGDAHDWTVWHGRAPFAAYTEHYPRFLSEYGFQSFPEMRTVESFTTPADRASIFTPVMLSHQKNDEGNAIIREYLLRDYGPPKSFADLLYMSQVLQAEGVKVGAEHLRRIRPRNMGSLFWQLNDCWPVASWSSIDYFGRWKALQYYARRFYAPLLVSPFVENGNLNVYLVSDKTAPVIGQLRVRLLGFDGKVFLQDVKSVTIKPLSSHVMFSRALTDLLATSGADANRVVVATDLSVGNDVVSSNLLYLVPTKQIVLPKPAIQTQLRKPDGSHYELSVTSNVLARSVHIFFDHLDTQLSDDYFDLLPGKTVKITFSSNVPIDQVRRELHVISIANAVSPASTNVPLSPIAASPDWKP